MSQIQQILNYVKSINQWANLLVANAKKVEELPVMNPMNPEGLLIASEQVDGIWVSKQLEIQKIIDGISLAGQDNKVREILLGSITDTQDLNYLLDNNGITVTENEIVILTALATVNATLVQKQYLWKLGKGSYNPIGSTNISTKLIELQPRFLNDITAEELTSSPSAIVYDFGIITESILEVLNAASPARDYTDDEKIYYIRATKDGVNFLYNFIGINGTYGDGESQMTEADLVLVYSSGSTDITDLLVNKTDRGGYLGNSQDLNLRISAVEDPINARSYIEKYTIAYQPLTLDGEISELYMSSQRNALSFNGTMTILNSLLFADFISTSLYPGCDFYIRNNQLTSFIVPHKSVETTLHVFPFSFPSGKDLTLNPGEIIHFKLNRTSGDEGYFEFVGIDINGINSNLMHLDGDEEVDGNKTFLEPVSGATATAPEHYVPLAQMEAADAQILSDANDYTDTGLALKLNAADYNDRYKGTFLTEAALNAAHPTASAGDSAQVNEVGSTVVVNYSWDAEDNVWVNNGSGGSGATNTDALPEGSSNLYWTTARGLALVLTGLSLVTGGAIVSTDSVLVAFGKIQKQINDLTTANIPDSTNKRYVTDAQLTVIGNTSGTNSGNETATSIGALIGGAADATPNDSDFVATSLTAGGVLRKITWTNVKAFLKTYYDGLYLVPQITITTSVSITTATNDTNGFGQKGRHVVIDNSTNAINITVNGGTGFCASYLKHGTGAITFVQGSGRTLSQVDGTAVLNGSVGSTATISSVGTKDYLRISNA